MLRFMRVLRLAYLDLEPQGVIVHELVIRQLQVAGK
jgi:hypothetical protein